MRDSFVEELTQAARKDERIMLVVGDLGYGVVNKFAQDLPRQFVNAGVAEQSMIGIASGLALAGQRVFVYSIANFPTMRCLEQIRNDVAYHGLDVTIVSVGAGLAYGNLGYTHHGVEDLSVMRSLSGMSIYSPSDPVEAASAVHAVLAKDGPAYVRLGKNGERRLHPENSRLNIANAQRLRSGSDVVFISTGSIVSECLSAAERLASVGIEGQVWSVPRLCPFDDEWLESLEPTAPIVTVEEHVLEGGLGSIVLEHLNDSGLNRQIKRIGIRRTLDNSKVGSAEYLREVYGLDSESIARAALDSLNIKEFD